MKGRQRFIAAKSAAARSKILGSRTAAGVVERLWGVNNERADYQPVADLLGGQDRVYTSGLLCSWLRSDCICRGGCGNGCGV